MFDPETHEIAIKLPGQSPVAEADRMLHEHIHAISEIVLDGDSRLTELQVNTVSTTLIDLLCRNRELREFLLNRLTTDNPTNGGS